MSRPHAIMNAELERHRANGYNSPGRYVLITLVTAIMLVLVGLAGEGSASADTAGNFDGASVSVAMAQTNYPPP